MVKIPAFIGWILIVVGVWGEFFTDGLVSDADASIQSFISITLSQSEKETAFALERAAHAEATARRFEAQIAESAARVKTAEARIASADSASRQAVATVSSAEARIAEAQRAAAESKKEAARLTKEAEAERLERMKLEAIVAPRSLSLDSQKGIADACARFAGHNVLVGSYGMDGEGAGLATQVMSALKAARIVVKDGRGSTVTAGQFDFGVQVRFQQAEEYEFASCLVDALSRIGSYRSRLTIRGPSWDQ